MGYTPCPVSQKYLFLPIYEIDSAGDRGNIELLEADFREKIGNSIILKSI